MQVSGEGDERRIGGRGCLFNHEEARILHQAAGVVDDWRMTLLFLSRLSLERVVSPSSEEVHRLQLKEVDSEVVDSFFRRLTQDKVPNTAHMLLAHLADILRIGPILTTNFDTLIEQAFTKLDMPVAAYPVHRAARFPDVMAVRGQRCVVKIHGGRYGLRADLSLDSAPDPVDVQRFLHYLALPCEPGDERHRASPDAPSHRNILVMGVSGRERRTLALVCEALAHFNRRDRRRPRSHTVEPQQERLTVYWLCYTNAQIGEVKESFDRVLRDVDRAGDGAEPPRYGPPERYLPIDVHVVAVNDLALFLLDLYQHVFLCLPPSGAPYNAVWGVPPPPRRLVDKRAFAEAEEKLRKQIENAAGLLRIKGDGVDVASVATQCFVNLSGSGPCAWLDLDNVFTISSFAAQIVECIGRLSGTAARGLFIDPERLSGKRDWDEVRRYLDRVLGPHVERVATASCSAPTLFVNARDYPGMAPLENGSSGALWNQASVDAFWKLLEWLAHYDLRPLEKGHDDTNGCKDKELRPKIKIVVIHREGDMLASDSSTSVNAVDVDRSRNHIDGATPDVRVQKYLRRTDSDPATLSEDFGCFLRGLLLFHEPCYRSVLHSWALMKAPQRLLCIKAAAAAEGSAMDNDEQRFHKAADCVQHLEHAGIVRTEDGHRVFLGRSVRDCLLKALPGAGGKERLELAATHQGVADWYVKLFRSCGDIEALIRALFHRARCIQEAAALGAEGKPFVQSAVIEIRTTLDLAVPHAMRSARLSACAHFWQQVIDETQKAADVVGKGGQGFDKLTEALARQKIVLRAYQSEIRGVPECIEPSPLGGPWPGGEGATTLAVVRQCTTQRRYREALESAEAGFDVLGGRRLFDVISNAYHDGGLVNQGRAQARAWVTTHEEPGRRADMIHFLRRLQLLKLHEAELFRHAAELDEERGVSEHPHAQRQQVPLRQAELIYICSTEMMRYVDDVDYLSAENGMLRTNTGTILSWMGRHSEAHRRYNEAYAYFDHLEHKPAVAMHYATVDLRRTEDFLAQYAPLSPLKREELRMRKYALLYDACCSVQRAAYKSRGAAVEARWHAWLHELELAVCRRIYCDGFTGELGYCHPRLTLGQWGVEALTSGMELADDDRQRLARYYFLGCLILRHLEGPDANLLHLRISECRGRLEEVPSAGSGTDVVDKYVRDVLEFFAEP
jgi:hypothetical protein